MFEALPAGLERCKLGVFDQHLGTLTTLNSTLTYDADGRLTMSTTFVTHEVLNQPPPLRPNKGRKLPAEAGEGRTSPKGNGGQTAAARTPSRGAASDGLAGVRQAARRSKDVRFTALRHHITIELLERSYSAGKPSA